MLPEVDIEQLEDDLAKGSLMGEEAEAAQKLVDEAAKAKEDEEVAKKAEEEKVAFDKLSDEEKAKAEEEKTAADKKAEEDAAAEAKAKEEEEAKAAYDKLSDEDKAAFDKKAEEEAEAAAEAERAERNKGIKIPKFRLDAANVRAKKAEIERDELQAKLDEALKSSSKATDLTDAQKHDKALTDMDTQIAEAMKDGDSKEVAKLMADSRSLERDYQSGVTATNLKTSSAETTAKVNETTLVNSILDQLEAEYPMFDEGHADFNADANADVLRMQQGLIASGESAADALVEAVNMVLPKYGVVEKDEGKDDKAEKSEAEKKAIADKAAADKKNKVDKNIKDAGNQAPGMDDSGDDSDSAGQQGDLPNISELTDKEYDALPEATRKKMRGDEF